jgi:hypothetical protein
MNLPTHELSPDERSARTRGALNEFIATLVVWWMVGLGLVPVTVYILIQFDTPERGSLITVLGWIVVPSNAVNYRASPHQAEMISGEEKPPLPMVRCHA